MLDLARTLGIPRLTAAHFVDNPASGAVLRKLGFRPTGRRIERASLGRGTPAPTVEYVREVAAPGQDRDDDDGPVAMLGAARWQDRQSGVEGKRVSVRVELGGRRLIENQTRCIPTYRAMVRGLSHKSPSTRNIYP